MTAACRWICCLALLLAAADVHAEPTTTDDRLVIELVAREPDIVTPTGLAVDEQGRLWVIENHTHQRPASYKGPPSDRVRIFADFDAAGRPRKISTFADGFRNAMSLALAADGTVFLATRSDIYRMRDDNGTAADRPVIVKLESKGDYPHNGLAGFAFDGLGNLYFALGENLGESYKLIGSDGTTLSGGGEGGSIYRCKPDGSGLHRIATGFWNTFHLTIDAFGRLFAVDNDPDSRGPCRLLHIVPGGDYGYRFRFGRKGLHPFVAWNGELPGTLPMLAGTGEAPSGIIAYEANGLPPEYRGNLLGTSWGDHLIERFRLSPNGASFRSQTQTLMRGGEDFRPVGIAVGPDGAVYLSDWVDKSYPVHGKGALWRIRMKQPPADDGLRPSKVATLDPSKLRPLLADPRSTIRAAARDALASKGPATHALLAETLRDKDQPRARVEALWAAARMEAVDLIGDALKDTDPDVRAEAARLHGTLLPTDVAKRDESRLLPLALKDAAPAVRMQAILQLRTGTALASVVPVLADPDPFLVGAALDVLGRAGNAPLLLPHADAADARLRLGIMLALRRTADAEGRSALAKFLQDADPEVRRTAIQWVGEERLQDLAAQLPAAAAKAPVTRDLFLALLAANNLLAGGQPKEEPADDKFLGQVLQDAAQPAAFRVLALQMLRPDHAAIRPVQLRDLLAGQDQALRRQAARTLAQRADTESQQVLRRLAADADAETALRSEAILGLTHSAAASADTRRQLLTLLDRPELERDALRSLREPARQVETAQALLDWWDKAGAARPAPERRELAAQLVLALRSVKAADIDKRLAPIVAIADARPKGLEEWRTLLADGGDATAGERVFFHPGGARCYSCHRIDGRGAQIGPDLSQIGRALSRPRLIESILEPSKEIAPQFVSWSITTRDGKVRSGVIVDEGPHSTVTVADAQGKLEVLKRQDIEERHALPTSLMPDNLHELMTPREFVDLIAFLCARR